MAYKLFYSRYFIQFQRPFSLSMLKHLIWALCLIREQMIILRMTTDYITEKIIVDTSMSTIMLIRFDSDATRNTKLKFDDVAEVRIPRLSKPPGRTTTHLKDNRKF